MKLNYFLFSLLLILFPTVVFGAGISIEPRNSSPALGDTAIFDVYLDTDGQTINTVDGSILLVDQNKLFFQDCFTANSIFSLWPSQPAYNTRNKIISFIGGVPGGIKTSHGLLFSLIFSAKDAGEVVFSPKKIVAYLNNEKATPVNVNGQSLSLVIAEKAEAGMKNDWQTLIASDKIPPLPFIITLNQDQNLFGGQKFISFATTDNETGIDYYEIKEGKFPPERAEIQYVLQDQTLQNEITVTAYDRAGNGQVATLSGVKKSDPKPSSFRMGWWVIGLVIILLLIILVRRKLKMKNK